MKAIHITKKVIYALTIMICMLFVVCASRMSPGEQTMNLKSAVLVSFGFGTAIELIRLSGKYT